MSPNDYNCTLNDIGKKRAKAELGEIETDRLASVQAFRDWVLAQKSYMQSPTDTQFLLSFLRHRKYSQKAAKERLIEYWRLRSENPDMCANIDTSTDIIQNTFHTGVFVPMPNLDKDGCLVVLGRIGSVDPKMLDAMSLDINRATFAMIDFKLTQDMVQVCGVKFVHDFTGVTIDHLRKLEAIFSRVSKIAINAYPIRINASCYYNVGAVFEFLFVLLRKFFPEKIRNRISTHSSLQSVYEKVDKSVFPEEYLPDDYDGPNSGPLKTIIANYAKEMKDPRARDYIAKLSGPNYHCDVNNIPNDAVPTESFRTLKVD